MKRCLQCLIYSGLDACDEKLIVWILYPLFKRSKQLMKQINGCGDDVLEEIT